MRRKILWITAEHGRRFNPHRRCTADETAGFIQAVLYHWVSIRIDGAPPMRPGGYPRLCVSPTVSIRIDGAPPMRHRVCKRALDEHVVSIRIDGAPPMRPAVPCTVSRSVPVSIRIDGAPPMRPPSMCKPLFSWSFNPHRRCTADETPEFGPQLRRLHVSIRIDGAPPMRRASGGGPDSAKKFQSASTVHRR